MKNTNQNHRVDSIASYKSALGHGSRIYNDYHTRKGAYIVMWYDNFAYLTSKKKDCLTFNDKKSIPSEEEMRTLASRNYSNEVTLVIESDDKSLYASITVDFQVFPNGLGNCIGKVSSVMSSKFHGYVVPGTLNNA